MTSLNERAAKCMGWGYQQRFSGDYCTVPGTMRTHDPANSLDDAALIRDKAIDAVGWDRVWDSIVRVAFPDENYTPTLGQQMQAVLTAPPARITEAACRCLEAHPDNNPAKVS